MALIDFFKKNKIFYEFNSETKSYVVKGGKIRNSVLEIPAFYDNGINGEHPVTEIAAFAFHIDENKNMKNVNYLFLPDTLTKIRGYAFAHSSISNFILPPNVTELEDGVFYGCRNLKTVKLNNKITTIPKVMFGHCKSLVSIDIPENITSIGKGAFIRSQELKEINLPISINSIDPTAFEGASEAAVEEYQKWKDFNQFKRYVADDILEMKKQK